MNVQNFNILYLSLVDKLSLPVSHSDLLLEFIRIILPENNNLPCSVYKIKRKNVVNEIRAYKLCKICETELVDNKCSSENCLSHRTNIKKNIQVHCAKVSTQLGIILKNHSNSIKQYTSI